MASDDDLNDDVYKLRILEYLIIIYFMHSVVLKRDGFRFGFRQENVFHGSNSFYKPYLT